MEDAKTAEQKRLEDEKKKAEEQVKAERAKRIAELEKECSELKAKLGMEERSLIEANLRRPGTQDMPPEPATPVLGEPKPTEEAPPGEKKPTKIQRPNWRPKEKACTVGVASRGL